MAKEGKDSRKTLNSVLSAISLLVIGSLIFVDIYADSKVKQGIESAATEALGVGVDVNSLDLAITNSKLVILNLAIDNPPGYEHEPMIRLDRIKVYVDSGSLLTDEVKIRQIKIEGVDVILEQNGTTNNLKEVIDFVSNREDKENVNGKKLLIETVEIYGIKVKVFSEAGQNGQAMTFDAEPIKMANIGINKKLDTTGLIAMLFLSLATEAAHDGAGKLPDKMLGALSSTLEKTLNLGGMLTGGGKRISEGQTDGAEQIKPNTSKD